MVSLGVIVVDELAEEMAQVPFPEDHKVFEAFCADRPEMSPAAASVACKCSPGRAFSYAALSPRSCQDSM